MRTTQSVEVRRRVGYLPEDTPLYKDMTVLEYLRFVCEVRAIEPSIRATASIRRAVDQCGLGDRLGFLIAELSKGYRQRVGLAQAIIHEPEVLILDEPTSGLDPNQIGEIRRGHQVHRPQSKTVIFSTHVMQEVQATCTRVLIIANGKIAADGTPDELQRLSAGKSTVIVEVGGARGNAAVPEGAHGAPRQHRGHRSCSTPSPAARGSASSRSPARIHAPTSPACSTTANDMDLLQLTPERASRSRTCSAG